MRTEAKPASIDLDPELHRVLSFKAAETRRSVAELVNEAVRWSLTEDAEDLAAFEERRDEPNLSFENVVRDLKRRGKL